MPKLAAKEMRQETWPRAYVCHHSGNSGSTVSVDVVDGQVDVRDRSRNTQKRTAKPFDLIRSQSPSTDRKPLQALDAQKRF